MIAGGLGLGRSLDNDSVGADCVDGDACALSCPTDINCRAILNAEGCCWGNP
jgi:hypothetical protein